MLVYFEGSCRRNEPFGHDGGYIARVCGDDARRAERESSPCNILTFWRLFYLQSQSQCPRRNPVTFGKLLLNYQLPPSLIDRKLFNWISDVATGQQWRCRNGGLL